MQVELDDAQMGVVEEYAGLVGVTVKQCLDSILDEWIQVVARAVSQNEKFNIEAMRLSI